MLPRNIIILAGEKAWQVSAINKILQGHHFNILWVSDKSEGGISKNIKPLRFLSTTTFKHAANWLGQETEVVTFDANEYFEVDAFAAVCGIVMGGGVFFLLMPAEEDWKDIYSSYFGQRLLHSIKSNDLLVLNETSANENFQLKNIEDDTRTNCERPFLTKDQQHAVESIEQQILDQSNNPVVLISDRGRGKSATLGIVAAKLMQTGIKNIAITAPRMRATDIVFKHIASLLPEATCSRGKVVYGESVIKFYSPDQLMHENIPTNLLLVDEAAAIPVPILTSFLQQYSQCIFATTVHGYEGTGRGFSLKFIKVLSEKYPNWINLQLTTPIRWSNNDPLEQWMFSLLCLDAEIADKKFIHEFDLNNIKYTLLNKDDYANNDVLLQEVFALLVLAHYRTRPKDLKSLLDDDALTLYVAYCEKHVVAVALVIREGNFLDSLSTKVYRGERRAQGHLLAQAITYHCGVESAAMLDYARVMRIAVHPNIQHKGIGTALIRFVIENEKHLGRDAIGCSFGMNKELLKFWLNISFDVVRIGFTREQTSGEHAAIMLLPLSTEGRHIYNEANSRFKHQLQYWFDDVLQDIPIDIKDSFKYQKIDGADLNTYDEKDLLSFKDHSRNYELCIAAINKFVYLNKDEIGKNNFPDNYRQVIHEKVTEKNSWNNVSNKLGLNGKNDTRKLFHGAIVELIERNI